MPTTIQLDPDIEMRLETLAAKTGLDKEAVLRSLIENGIDEFEDAADALRVRDQMRRGEVKMFSDAEMRAELGLEN